MALLVLMVRAIMHTEQSVPHSGSKRRRTVLAVEPELASEPRVTKTHSYMKRSPKVQPDQEPIGIVISRGTRHEDVPTVWAYVWGPAPEIADGLTERAF